MDCIIIGGFLGSGKTTFVNYLLKHFGELHPENKTVLLINEFGEIPVDAALMDSGNYIISEVTGGCICCTLKGVLAEAVTELKEKENPDLLVIEATGLAVPSEIACLVGPAGGCSVFTQLCVDPDQYCKLAGRLAIYDRQLADADMVLLTKNDIRSSELLHKAETEISGANEVIRCFSSNDTAAEAIFSSFKGIPALNQNYELGNEKHSHEKHSHEKHELKQDICQHTERFSELSELSRLEKYLAHIAVSIGAALFRIKGIVNTAEGWVAVQFTNGKMQVKSVDASSEKESFIVYIGECDSIERIKNNIEKYSIK